MFDSEIKEGEHSRQHQHERHSFYTQGAPRSPCPSQERGEGAIQA